MNDFGLIVLGVAARATALALFGLLLAMILKRRGPSAGALAMATTLAVLVGVSALAFSPWPRWWSPTEGMAKKTDHVASSVVPAVEPPGETGAKVEANTRPVAPPRPSPAMVGLLDSLREIGREVANPSAPVRATEWRWPAWAACAFLVGLAVAMVRLALGLWSIQSLRSRSQPVDDPGLLAVVGSLRDEMGLVPTVEVLETAEVGTPATIGWRRPAILLPSGWSEWDNRERRAVLAHEMAHVLRSDYLAGLAAQISVSLHFYHPLVHALATRLRLQQEMAADTWGARLSGGRRPYLTALTTLALRQDPRSAAWPARPFLPTRGTFLRRIEMLRDPKTLPHVPLPRRGRAALITGLIAAGLIVAGFRGPTPPNQARAQDAPVPKTAPSNAIDPATAAADVRFVIDIRPAAILARPEWKKVAEEMEQTNSTFLLPKDAGIKLEEIEQVLVLGFDRKNEHFIRPGTQIVTPPQIVTILRATRPFDWKGFMMPEAVEVKHEGATYYRIGRATCYRKLDDRTLLIGMEIDAKNPPVGADRPKVRHSWDDAWKKAGPGPFRAAMETAWMARLLQPVLAPNGQPGGPSPMVAMIGPLLDKTDAYAMALGVADGVSLQAVATCGTGEGADRVADTLRALLTLGSNTLPNLRKMADAAPPDAAPSLRTLVATLTEATDAARVEREGTTVRLRSKIAADAASTVTRLLLPAAQAQSEMTRRVRSVNNLKQIGLAMHNYHAANGKLPPAVLYGGPDGKTPYSWRVAILPYVEGQKLYSQYKFDEPWDGPNNRKLIEQRPTIYANPNDVSATNSAYFALTGPTTLFPDRKEGVAFQEVLDGTRNTIMVVEAKRDIPWSKPEDIPYDAGKPLPVFGGFHPSGFNVAFADGSVRFLKDSIDQTVLRHLFTRAGGEAIQIPDR